MAPDEKQIARRLVEMKKIRVYLFTAGTDKSISLTPEEAVAFLFSDIGCEPNCEIAPFNNLSPDEFVLAFLAEFDLELSADKIGIQCTNYSVIRFMDYARYLERYSSIQQKLAAKQTLSRDETLLNSGFSEISGAYSESKIKETIYFRNLYLAMMGWACRLAATMKKHKQVSLCPDDTHRNISAKCSIFELGEYTGMKFALDSDITGLLQKHNIRDYIVYCESELKESVSAPCECVFCRKMRCPSLVSAAIGRLEAKGCGIIVNFYPEYDGYEFKGCGGSTVPHFERVERGTLHKMITDGCPVRICNVFSGKRTFAVLHEPLTEKEKEEVLSS